MTNVNSRSNASVKSASPGESVTPHEQELEHRIAFQRVLMNLAVGFVNAPLDKLDREIDAALQQVGEFSGSDRAYLFSYDLTSQTTSNTHEWCAPGIEPAIDELQDVPLAGIEDWVDAHQSHQVMHVPYVADLDPDSALRGLLEPQGILTLITVPLWIEGNLFGFVGFDAVTHRKYWTEDEVTLLEVLAELFANAWLRRDRENELIKARHDAELASIAKDRFLANMSHELRTPMNGILGMTEVLLASDLNAQQRTFAETVYQSSEQLMQLLNDVLEVTRVQSSSVTLDHTTFNPGKITTEVVQLATSALHAKKLRISTDIDPQLPELLVGDPVRLWQILSNIISNAIKFTETGGIQIQVVVENLTDSTARLMWSIADTGIGISEEFLPDIFEPFSQEDTSSERRYGGSGLGLRIVRDLVDLMGGDIDVTSNVGSGSTFLVSLEFPLATEPETGDHE